MHMLVLGVCADGVGHVYICVYPMPCAPLHSLVCIGSDALNTVRIRLYGHSEYGTTSCRVHGHCRVHSTYTWCPCCRVHSTYVECIPWYIECIPHMVPFMSHHTIYAHHINDGHRHLATFSSPCVALADVSGSTYFLFLRCHHCHCGLCRVTAIHCSNLLRI